MDELKEKRIKELMIFKVGSEEWANFIEFKIESILDGWEIKYFKNGKEYQFTHITKANFDDNVLFNEMHSKYKTIKKKCIFIFKTAFNYKDMSVPEQCFEKLLLELRYRLPEIPTQEIVKHEKKPEKEVDVEKQLKRREIYTNVFVEWNIEGIKKIQEYDNHGSRDMIIMDVGISLIKIFESQNRVRFYQVKIGDEIVIKTKDDLINEIEVKDYSFVKKYDLRQFISIVLREEAKNKSLKVNKMYDAIGVFIDKNDNLVVCYPGENEIMLQGTNGYQERIIKLNETRGIDTNGDLIKDYVKIIEFKTIPNEVMLITLGHCIIAPFFYALKDSLDIFPAFFWLTPPGSVGKTSHLEIFYVFLFGTELKNNDDVDSPSRLSQISTSHTPALYMDDIDDYTEDVLTYLKGQLTRLSPRERLNKEQKLNSEETYMSYVGSGNSNSFLSGEENNAFRDRCLITDLFNEIPPYENKVREFEELHSKLKKSKISGLYVLKESIKFVENMIEGESPTSLKLEMYFREKKMKINDYLKREKISLLSSRRHTIYTLLYIGWEFWEYVIKGKGLECKILSEYLDYNNNDKFKNLIQSCEDQVSSFSFKELDNLMLFYSKNKDLPLCSFRDTHKNIILDAEFIREYDKWARQSVFQPITYLTILAEILTKLLRRKIDAKVHKVYRTDDIIPVNPGPACLLSIRGVEFPEEEIRQRLGLSEEKENNEKEDFNNFYDLFIDELYFLFGDLKELEKKNVINAFKEKYSGNILKQLIDKAINEGKITQKSNIIILND